jgi:pimeloyl-ACP methyl ester carboxylesterase
VLLVHGFPRSWYEWRYVIPLLAGEYRVIAADLRGSGDASGGQFS